MEFYSKFYLIPIKKLKKTPLEPVKPIIKSINEPTELEKAQETIKILKQQLDSKEKEFNSKLENREKELAAQLKRANDLDSMIIQNQNKIEELQREIDNFKKKESNKVSTKNSSIINFEILDSKKLQEYETIEEIGFGSSGKVFKVAMRKYYALKTMNMKIVNSQSIQHFLNEYEIMNMLNHPNILKALGISFGDEKNPPAILLPYCPKNLFTAIKNNELTKVQIACAIYEIAEGMKYLHLKKIIHRDLKPSNILIAEDGTIKICDFGISKLITPDQFSLTVGIGTNKFMAPELILEEDDYNEKIDVYSFGVLIFFILNNGELPKIKTGEIIKGKKAEIPSSFSKFSADLINSCWNLDPKERPSFNDICNLMKSNNYKLVNFSKSEEKEVNIFVQNHQKLLPSLNE